MSVTRSAARLLLNSRSRLTSLEALPKDLRPTSLAEAYETQSALQSMLLFEHGGRQIGYKIACTSKMAQDSIGVNEPFRGALLSHSSQASPAHIDPDSLRMRLIEPEFALELTQDLEPSTSHTHESVAMAVGSVSGCIEVVTTSYADWTKVGAPSVIADQACHGAWIRGQAVCGKEDALLAGLDQHRVVLKVNDECVSEGLGERVLGHPLHALAWLANDLGAMGHALRAGDVISTGVCVEHLVMAEAGDIVAADFGEVLGKVIIDFGRKC